MKKLQVFAAGLLILASLVVISCKSGGTSGTTPTPTPEKTISELLPTVWSANIISESGTVVYDKSKTTNTKDGYKNFKLDLTSTSAAKLTEFDGNTFTGSYTFTASTNTLTLSGLNPQPTGTGGTISFTVSKKSDTNLIFTRTTASTKTGGTNNTYDLVK